uniref:Tudor domain containing 15 n=1 Tax=Scleropages formosus TaxID=113540 RepID=A0A8C9W7D0_SCLFO
MVLVNRNKNTLSHLPAPCALWSVELNLTHVDCSPGDTLVHFQGQYLTVCELDYDILQVEIQNAEKRAVSVDLAGLYLVEDTLSGCWYRGRVQNIRDNLYEVFLVDYGSVLTVDASHLACASGEMFMLPPKIVCGFFANFLPAGEQWDAVASEYFSSLIGTNIKGYIQALLPHKVMILEVPEVTRDLLKRKFCFGPSQLQDFENILSFHRPKLSVGTKYRARITAAIKPSVFYCQLTSMAEDLKDMTYNLSLCCDLKTKDPLAKSVRNMGLLCAARGKDEKWHRGLVQCLPVNSQVRILFIDFGFCESVKVENICHLPPHFLSLPFMAFPCILSNTSESDVAVRKEQFDLFKKGLLGGVLGVQIDHFSIKENLYIVTLCTVGNEDSAEFQNSKNPTRQVTSNASTGLYEKDKVTPHNGCAVQYTNELTDELNKKAESFVSLDSLKGVKEKSVFRGIVEHVLNPSDFWLRTEERNSAFEDMTEKLKAYFTDLPLDAEILENPVPGCLCSAMYEKDWHYYRAVIKKIIKHGAEVYFIDFGNSERVPYMLIKKLPLDFTAEPAFAMNCSLAHVVPVEDVWTVSASDYFKKAVLNKVLTVYVVHRQKDKLVVELRDEKVSESINTQMVKAELAKSTPVTKVRCMSRNINKVSSEPRKSQNVVTVRNGGSCRESVESMTKTESQKKQAPAKVKQLTFGIGSELHVRCCHINSPSDFWCQPKSKLGCLKRLMTQMQDYYEKHEDALQPNEEYCVIKRVEDGRWYRGCIVGTLGHEVSVILVDFGIILREKAHKLRAVKAEYFELEGLAFRCSFHGLIEPVEKFPNVWSREASSLLRDFVNSNLENLTCCMHAMVVMKHLGLFNIVELHAPHQSATRLLVEKGFAKKINCPKPLISSLSLFSYVFSMFDIKIGSRESVYVTHVCSPWEFYCQLERNSEMLENLMEKVTRKSSEIVCENVVSSQERLCFAKYFEDGQWYRGLVFPVKSNLHFNILFVDYGNMQVVQKKNVLPIPSDATELLFTPMQALRCRLFSVPKGDASMEVISFLKKAALNVLLEAKFVGKDEDGTLVCDLFDGNLHLNEKIQELMAMHGKSLRLVEKRSQCQTHQTLKKLESPKTGSSKSCAVGQGDKPQRGVNAAQNPSGNSAEERHQSKELSRPLKEQIGNITLEKPNHLPEMPLKAGFRRLAFVFHGNTVSDFYIQMKNDKQTVLEMCEQLNSAFFRENPEQVIGPVNTSDFIAAEYKEDGTLYWAVVTDVNDGHLTVEFFDYGNVATVEKREVLVLTNTFLTQPRLSTHCSQEKSPGFGNDDLFQSLVTGKPIVVEFVRQCGSKWTVKTDVPLVQQLSQDNCSSDKVNDVFSGSHRNENQTKDEYITVEEKEAQSCCTDMEYVERVQTTCDSARRNNLVIPVKSERSTNVNHVKVQLTGKHQLISSSEHHLIMKSCVETPQVAEVTFLALSNLPGSKQANTPHQIIIKPGQNEEGTLLSVFENGGFIIRLKQNKETFALLSQLLGKNVVRSNKVSVMDSKEGFESGLQSKSSKKQWCRAMVQKVFSSKEQCLVYCLDNGTPVVVSDDSIEELPVEVKHVPIQAVFCRLTCPYDFVSEFCKTEMLAALIRFDMVKVVFVTSSETSQLWRVDTMINGVLQQLEDSVKNIVQPRKTSLNGNRNQIQTFCIEENPVPRHPVVPVETDVRLSGVSVTLVDPSEFHVILEKYLLTRSMVSTALKYLPEDFHFFPEAHWIPSPCCLLSSDVNKLCRAEFLDVDNVSEGVSLVDYGHCVDVPYLCWQEVKQLPEKLTRIPKEHWSDEALVFSQQGICERNLMIYFRQYVSEAQWEMDVASQGVNIVMMLVDSGHAMYINSFLGLPFQREMIPAVVLCKLNTGAVDTPVSLKPLGDHGVAKQQCEDNRHSNHSDDPRFTETFQHVRRSRRPLLLKTQKELEQ